MIEALRANRNNLIRALQTERILRENPKFKPTEFSVDLTGLSELQMSQTATEYGNYFNDVLQVSADVQAEMRKLEYGRRK